jgi:aspartate carbamoyltransferase regulatory subunit
MASTVAAVQLTVSELRNSNVVSKKKIKCCITFGNFFKCFKTFGIFFQMF